MRVLGINCAENAENVENVVENWISNPYYEKLMKIEKNI